LPVFKYRPPALAGVFLSACLLVPTLGQAAAFKQMTEADLFGEIPRVSSATGLAQELRNAPASVTLIDRRMIEASGAVNIADLFKLVPGFQAYHVNANKFAVVSHGQGEQHPGRLEVTIDGRSVYQSALSTVDWSMLGVTLDDIHYIEAVRGPNVATQGSNAFMGAINIITYTPLEQSGSSLRTTLGALDTQEYAFRHNDRIGSFNYRLGLNYHKNEGTGIGFSEDDPGTGVRMEDGAELSQLNLSGIYTPTLRDSLHIQLGLGDGQIGVGSANHPEKFNPREESMNYQSLSWERILSPQRQLRVQANHSRADYDQGLMLLSDMLRREDPDNFGGLSSAQMNGFIASVTGDESDQPVDKGAETGVTERYDLELQLTQAWNPALRLVAGAGMRQDRVKSRPNLGDNRTQVTDSQRLFGNLEWQASSDWIANLGAMLEHNQDAGTRLSPRAGLNWHASEQTTFRAAASRAYRMPSLMEQHTFAGLVLPSNGQQLDLDTYTPEPLRPERVDALELGYLFDVAALRSSFDLKVYVEEVSDGVAEQWAYGSRYYDNKIITPDASGESTAIPATDGDGKALQLVSIATWRTKGLEAQWTLQPWTHTWFFLGYAYADTQGTFDRRSFNEAKPDQNDPVDLGERIPSHGVSLLASHALGAGFEVSVAFYRQTSVNWSQGSPITPYNRVDGRLAKKFQGAGVQGSLELILQSFTAPYTEFEDNNSVDARGFIRLTLEFI
jgi:iron complex outermembrane receptor protein